MNLRGGDKKIPAYAENRRDGEITGSRKRKEAGLLFEAGRSLSKLDKPRRLFRRIGRNCCVARIFTLSFYAGVYRPALIAEKTAHITNPD